MFSLFSIACPFHGHGAPITPLHKIHKRGTLVKYYHHPTGTRPLPTMTPTGTTMRHGSKHAPRVRARTPHTTIPPHQRCTP